MNKDNGNGTKPGTPAELAGIYPAARSLTLRVGSEEVTLELRPLSIERIGAMSDALGPILDEIIKSPSFATLSLLLMKHYRHTIKAVAAAIEWPPARVGAIEASSFQSLVWAIVEANADFFARLLGPVAYGIPAAIAGADDGDGPTPLDSSAVTAIPTPSATH